jgi:dTDP-4-dehydrorhamnose reductase
LTSAAVNLAKACAPHSLPLIHLSSYRVFGSGNKSIHSEKDIPAPMGVVGQAFLSAEQALADSLEKWIALRVSWVVGSYGDNHLTRILEPLLQGKKLTLNRRLRGAPTALSDVARVAVAMAKQIVCGAENWGVMHYCSGDACTEVEFAEQVIHTLRQQELLTTEPTLTLVDQLSETEPVSAVLSCRRARDSFGIQARSWRPSLLPMIKQWAHNNALAE